MRRPFGTWDSPLTPALAAKASKDILELHVDGDMLYWIEARPEESGRRVIMRRNSEGWIAPVLPALFSAANEVHTYGGGAMTVCGGEIFFSNKKDGRIYRMREGEQPVPCTLEAAVEPTVVLRYADFVFDARHRRLISIREDHRDPVLEARREVVSICVETGEVETLVSGSGFCAAPRLSPNGNQLAWIEWNHPHMPWDATRLRVAGLRKDGSLNAPKSVLNGEESPKTSILQPSWSPEGVLHFVCDKTGWWNLYRLEAEGLEVIEVLPVEFARPPWALGQSLYGFTTNGTLWAAGHLNGRWCLFSSSKGEDTFSAHPLEGIEEIRSLRCSSGEVFVLDCAPNLPPGISILSGEGAIVGRIGLRPPVPLEYISEPEAVMFPTTSGGEAHGFFYPPTGGNVGLPEELPPLIVMAHGGPTHAAKRHFRPEIQFWTSRGFAVLDVDYRGSTGYGRAYRELLKGHWGHYDVDDCVQGAEFLVKRGLVDPERLAIRGASAGGYTVLATLTFRSLFKAGVSYYGIGDLTTLCGDTHGFESQYLYGLVPESEWETRSPIHSVEQLSCPMLILQGGLDESVPPVQAKRMVRALRDKGIECQYVEFPDEGHGFGRAENIIECLRRELAFYQHVFGLTD